MAELVRIPPGHGKAVRVEAGARVRLVNTHGAQVVDGWAFNAYDLREFMSMEATRVWNGRINVVVGDVFVTNQRRPSPHPGGGHQPRGPRHPHVGNATAIATTSWGARAITATARTTWSRGCRSSG